MKNDEIESKLLEKHLIASGKKYAFYHLDYTVGDRIQKNYESIEPINFSVIGFEDCTFIPIIEKTTNKTIKSFIFLSSQYSPVLNRTTIEFPSFDISDEDFLFLLKEKYRETTGLLLKDFSIVENVENSINVYSDPGCCNKRSRVITLKIPMSEEDFNKLAELKHIDIIEIEGDICEKLKVISKQRNGVLTDKAWYWALGWMLKEKKFSFKN